MKKSYNEYKSAWETKQVYRRRYESRRSSKPKLHSKQNKIKYGEKRFSIGGWNSYTLQCGTIMTLISPGDCTLQCGMWLLNCDSEFTKWQQRAMWYVALGWHAIEFAQTSAILEFYIWFRFRPCHRSRHVILHESPKFYPNRTTLGREKMTDGHMSIFKMADLSHLKF